MNLKSFENVGMTVRRDREVFNVLAMCDKTMLLGWAAAMNLRRETPRHNARRGNKSHLSPCGCNWCRSRQVLQPKRRSIYSPPLTDAIFGSQRASPSRPKHQALRHHQRKHKNILVTTLVCNSRHTILQITFKYISFFTVSVCDIFQLAHFIPYYQV